MVRSPGADRVEMTSTGRVSGDVRTIRASLEVIRTPAFQARMMPGRSAWAFRDAPAVLYYHSLDEKEAGRAWIHPEGEVGSLKAPTRRPRPAPGRAGRDR